ncbi:MAG: DNA primase [Planctomycetota bacterium]|nr:MAG: DNA primase [Planctomycetota bacterium]
MVSADRQAEKELVRSRTPIAELARELTDCEFQSRGGSDLWACCPFHAEDTASFHVRPHLGLYKCFGCGASGDVFRFVQESRGVDFKEALQFLATRAGITLGTLSPEEKRAAAQARRLRDVLEAALQLFGRALCQAGNGAASYMAERGFSAETLEAFDVGFVPPDFRRLLLQSGVSSGDFDQAGFTAAFAGRVSFGIRDGNGALVGFGARKLGSVDGPKYVNTRETAAFNKRSLLYGLNKAARAATRSHRLVVMEGYTDVMMAHQRGIEDAVASMGTSFTEGHALAVPGRVNNLVLLFDGDRAGQDAAERSVRLLLARGTECRVLNLPDGQDPCDWLEHRDAESFAALLASEGVSTVSFLCRRELLQLDPGQPGAREAAARAVIEASRSLTDPLRRESVAREVAQECGVERNPLRRRAQRAASQLPAASVAVLPSSALVRSQLRVLAGLVAGPEACADVRALATEGLLEHRGALRLLELAGADPVDPSVWLERAAEQDATLAGWLECVLYPAPGSVTPALEQDLADLRQASAALREKRDRMQRLSTPDLASDKAAIRALGESIRAAHNPPQPNQDDGGGQAAAACP